MKKVIIIFMFLALMNIASASVGISPALQRIVFQPGMELDYTFKVNGDADSKYLERFINKRIF